jgi:hypothetical protein
VVAVGHPGFPSGITKVAWWLVASSVLYLDTSVIGAYFDEEFQEATRLLWRQMKANRFRFITSLVTIDELGEAPQRVRDLWRETFTPEMVCDVTNETEDRVGLHGDRDSDAQI